MKLPPNAVQITGNTNKSTVATKFKQFFEHLVASASSNISPLVRTHTTITIQLYAIEQESSVVAIVVGMTSGLQKKWNHTLIHRNKRTHTHTLNDFIKKIQMIFDSENLQRRSQTISQRLIWFSAYWLRVFTLYIALSYGSTRIFDKF